MSATTMEYATKTEIYQKIKKPLLERQRRARINKCLDGLKQLMVDLNGNHNILRMDKAEMLETTIVYLREHVKKQQEMPIQQQQQQQQQHIAMDSFRNGYMNAVNEVSRVLASTPGMTVEMGKTVMTHLGRSYKKLQHQIEQQQQQQQQQEQKQLQSLTIECPLSPASSGYHSDDNDTPATSPANATPAQLWRPW